MQNMEISDSIIDADLESCGYVSDEYLSELAAPRKGGVVDASAARELRAALAAGDQQ